MKKIENTSIGDSLVPWLGKTMKLIDNKIEDVLTEHNIDLTRIQFIVLKNIAANDGIIQNDLAFFSNRNKSSLTRMIATLDKKGYITKNTCKEDKRKCIIRISKSGKEVIDDASSYFSDFVVKMEQGILEEDKQNVIQLLKKIQNNIIGEDTFPFIKEKP